MSAAFVSKLTAKSQTTVPAGVRRALKLHPGDQVLYHVGPNGVSISKAEPLDWEYLRSLEKTLSEWNSPEDAAAFDDL